MTWKRIKQLVAVVLNTLPHLLLLLWMSGSHLQSNRKGDQHSINQFLRIISRDKDILRVVIITYNLKGIRNFTYILDIQEHKYSFHLHDYRQHHLNSWYMSGNSYIHMFLVDILHHTNHPTQVRINYINKHLKLHFRNSN